VSFDNVGENAILYKWLEVEARAKGLLFRHGDVRPITVLTPEDYEALLALRARGSGICELLLQKTTEELKYGPLDHFLFGKIKNPTELRLPSMTSRYDEIVNVPVARMKAIVAQGGAGVRRS
jgi:hypothetical protein